MKKIVLFLLLFVAAVLLLSFLYFTFSDCGVSPLSCGDYATEGTLHTQKIQVGGGPEDIAIDSSQKSLRFIVSCTERRANEPDIGGFYSINPKDNSTKTLTIIPTNFSIYPHGIDIVTIDYQTYLYAISHDKIDGEMKHSIARFVIQNDTLLLDGTPLSHSLMTGPNDLDVLEDGSIYISNPMPSNDPMESTKAILGIKNGNVLHYDGKNNWSVVVKDMCYPNGVWVDQSAQQLFVANGGCQEVVRFDLINGVVASISKKSTKEEGVNIPIGDNLLLDAEGQLWTAAHPCPLKFLDHAKSAENISPMQVYRINPSTMQSELIFQNNGALISAASTVLHWENRLYIAQVFNPFILVVDRE